MIDNICQQIQEVKDKNNLLSVSDVDSEIATRGWTDNAGNDVYRVSGTVRWHEGWDFSACIGVRCLIIFLTYDFKYYYSSFAISFIFDILRRISDVPLIPYR